MVESRSGLLSRPFAALLVLALVFAAFWFRANLLDLDPVRQAPERGTFNAASAVDRLGRVLDGQPHPVDSQELDQTRERLLAEIRALGYSPEVHDETACQETKSGGVVRCARVRNITFAAGPPARDRDMPVTLLTAHYDSVDVSPGFADDGIGIAVWLEVADVFRDAPPAGPVLFLLTDGEEPGLLGAKAFVDSDAYGRRIGAIVNLEARGVRGPAIMFETSSPNASVVLPWARNAVRPVSNSMAAAVYRILPNSTDLTVHLAAGFPGINIAIGDGLAFYHTTRDDLAELDPRSVQHMGDQALGAARAFASGGVAPSGEVVYSDVAGRFLVLLPQPFAVRLLIGFVIVSVLLLIWPQHEASPQGFSWSAFLLPPIAIAASAGLAFGLHAFLGALRPEPAFWTAHPQAFNSAIFLSALLVAALCLSFLASKASRSQLFAAGWFWLLAAGLFLSILVPGASILFVMPGVIFALAALVAFFWPAASLPVWTISGAGVLIVFLPILYLLDVMMGLSMAPLFGAVEALILAPLLALIGGLPRGRLVVLPPLAIALIAAVIVTANLPANTRARPLPLNYTARLDMAANTAQLAASQPLRALPPTVRPAFKMQHDAFLGQTGVMASLRDAPFSEHAAATARIEETPSPSGANERVLRLSAPGARMVRLRIPASAGAKRLSMNGSEPVDLPVQNGLTMVDCVGRSCDGAVLAFNPEVLAPKADGAAWTIFGVWPGLPASIAPLAPPRPATTIPIQSGDTTMTKTLFRS